MKVRIEWKYRSAKGVETSFTSEEMTAAQGVFIAEDIERTKRVKELVFIDMYDDSIWTMKEMKSYLKSIETEPHDITVYFDGGFNVGTKDSGLGCVIYYKQSGKSYRLRQNAQIEGLVSNNEAEYAALHLCVQELEFLEVRNMPVRFSGDSKIVINGMSGEWPVIESELVSWADRIEMKLKTMGIQAEFELIPRKENFEADRLATQALKGIEITGTSII
ncbi:reverse transcriptase-like protein [Planomicrobium okeanokoites]|uniref:Reverse transcriptase-like protein n=1 Tax=Planomicrobium okeanokoites TaxID=244 RepID=A0ABV7KKM1_PLAOK|nr:reverse transcriptase-like protein [Planomicrobium okeanokoites]TAA69573.1 reverse transcriptase-like protein [Planomicrobium okeanokoites]